MQCIMKKKRPLSPHLGIYKPQISSAVSILHRIASFIVLLGLLELISCFITALYMPELYQNWALPFYSSIYGKVLIIFWSYAFSFYLCTETRYMFWSFGIGFEIKQFTRSGYLAIIISIVIWALFWAMVHMY